MKKHHVCPKCKRIWRCEEAELCEYWETDPEDPEDKDCLCFQCDGITALDCEGCKEKTWSVS